MPSTTSPGRSFGDRWWPSTQSLDLIEGPIEHVAVAVETEFDKVAAYTGDQVTTLWQQFDGPDAAFSTVTSFDNVGSTLLLLPTHSRWVVMWNNSFLCDGFDRFCLALTTAHALTTIHWSAHDDATTFQPGAMFHHRRQSAGVVIDRRVQAARTDGRWDWYAHGEPLPEEDIDGYRAKRARDRLDERRMLELLRRLDARPWNEDWYALPERQVRILSRPVPPRALRKARDEVIRGRS